MAQGPLTNSSRVHHTVCSHVHACVCMCMCVYVRVRVRVRVHGCSVHLPMPTIRLLSHDNGANASV